MDGFVGVGGRGGVDGVQTKNVANDAKNQRRTTSTQDSGEDNLRSIVLE